MSDLKAAAERLRRVKSGEPSKVVYGMANTAAEHIDDCDRDIVERRRAKDSDRLADAYLAEMDETPATVEWMDAVGLVNASGLRDIREYRPGGARIIYRAAPGGWDSGVFRCQDDWVTPTRGRIRKLCKALGITLQESEAK